MSSADQSSTVNREPPRGLAHDAETLCEAFQRTAARYAPHTALRTPGGTTEISWAQYADRVKALAHGLHNAGVDHHTTVAMMLSNRPEAALIDTAALHLGATPFSIYNTSPPEQIEYILTNARAQVIVTECAFAAPLLTAAESVPQLEHVFILDGPVAGARSFAELEAGSGPDRFDFESAWRAVRPGDIATLIYTSGTTGPPKAVELTHRNLLAEMRMVDAVLPLQPCGRVVSYLPMAHLADRYAAYYTSLVSGATTTFLADSSQLLHTLLEVRPTFWGAVPRIWEKLKSSLQASFSAEPDSPVRAALAAALLVVRAVGAGEQIPAALAEADDQIFAPIREQIGLDQVRHLVSGAAPVGVDVLEFFAALGLPICEGWGMSELSLIATINPPSAIRIGTVGLPLPGIELKLADDGELLARGPTVMRRYRGAPQLTAETIDAEGWVHTGDIATIDSDGYVSIVDRKKDLIINSAGKNMSPTNIETTIKSACPLIASVIAIGDRRPYNTALIVLDPEATASFAAAEGLAVGPVADLATEDAVLHEVGKCVAQANTSLSRVEQIKRHIVLPTEWHPGGQELTPTMKLRRKPILDKYSAEIEAMYAEEPAPER